MPAHSRPLLNMMEHAYRVRNWGEHFETSESRKIKGPLSWVAIPTKHDGRGYKRAAKHPHAVQALAGWWSMLQVAAKMPVHGLLADRDGPLDAEDIADKTDLPKKIYVTALAAMSDERIGWLEKLPWDKNLDFAGNIAALVASQHLPASALEYQRGSAAPSGKQRSPKPAASPGSASASQESPATTSTPQPAPAENRGEQERTANASVHNKTRHNMTSPLPSPEGGPQADKLIRDPNVVKRLICEKILGGRNPGRAWSPDAENQLAIKCKDEGGIPLQEILEIAEYRSIPRSDDIPELKFRRDPVTETTLMNYWGDEARRAGEYFKKYSRNGAAEKKEPPEWRQFMEWKYGGEGPLKMPANFWQLPLTQREEYEREYPAFSKLEPTCAMEALNA